MARLPFHQSWLTSPGSFYPGQVIAQVFPHLVGDFHQPLGGFGLLRDDVIALSGVATQVIQFRLLNFQVGQLSRLAVPSRLVCAVGDVFVWEY